VAELSLKKVLSGREGRGKDRDIFNTRLATLKICIVSKNQL
jgi:hypothetical protein